jgi:hypothetical protein
LAKRKEVPMENRIEKFFFARLLQTPRTADKVFPPDVTDSGTLIGPTATKGKKLSTWP